MTKFNKIENERKISSLITLIILLLLYLILRLTNVPEPVLKDKGYDRIDWTRYHPKHIANQSQPKQDLAEESKPKPIVKSQGLKKINLSNLREKLAFFQDPARVSIEPPNLNNKKMNSHYQMKIAINGNSDPIFLSNSTFSHDFNQDDLPRTPGLAKFSYPLVQVKEDSQRVIFKEEPQHALIPCPLKVDKKKSENSKAKPIILIEIPKDIKPIMPKIFVDLRNWMKNNSTDLPEVIKKFMGYDSLDLASKIQFRVEDRIFNMYLVCKESILEIRICLIEGNQATMLIDRGFKKKSHYLRIGNTNRVNGKILSFGTTREAPSDEKTHEFYQIFISWWRSMGKERG